MTIKLAFIITGLDRGGAEMMLLKLLKRLSPDFTPEIVSLTSIGVVGQQIQELGIPVTALSMRRGIPDPISFWRLVAFLKHLQPSIVHTWMYHADLMGGLAAKLAGVSAIVWNIRHSDLSMRNSKLSTRLTAALCAKLSARIPTRIQCCSITARDIHVALGYHSDKFLITPNGFDLDRFQPDCQARFALRRELDVRPDANLVGLIARFDPQKNHVGFLESASTLHYQLPTTYFLLAGKGVDSNNVELMKRIDRLGLAKIVRLLGERDDVPRLMASLDVLASSSSFGEAFPNVIGEAMACGVPCAVTNVGDSAYIVGNTGKVVASGDMTGLAKAIESILTLSQEERQELGLMARQRIHDNFEIAYIVSLYEKLYKSLT